MENSTAHRPNEPRTESLNTRGQERESLQEPPANYGNVRGSSTLTTNNVTLPGGLDSSGRARSWLTKAIEVVVAAGFNKGKQFFGLQISWTLTQILDLQTSWTHSVQHWNRKFRHFLATPDRGCVHTEAAGVTDSDNFVGSWLVEGFTLKRPGIIT